MNKQQATKKINEAIGTLAANIASLTDQCREMLDENDLHQAALAASDAAALQDYMTNIITGDLAGARNEASRMETGCREQIPTLLWKLMGGDVRPQSEKLMSMIVKAAGEWTGC